MIFLGKPLHTFPDHAVGWNLLIAVTSLPSALMRAIASLVLSIAVAM
jgi:hypothetical protein